mmetsp:Transcript_16574/g.33534  ORF Transcript_16574/g.33534 Transcript_16574/m.33534 type:complete len:238 (-) Transcript_16574:442-1155(-)
MREGSFGSQGERARQDQGKPAAAAGSSSASCNSAKYSCSNALAASKRAAGSNCNSPFIRLQAPADASGYSSVQGCGGETGSFWRKFRAACWAGSHSMADSCGLPMMLTIFRTWSHLSLPLKTGTRPNSSPRMHPTAQMSTDGWEVCSRRSPSGDAYHWQTGGHCSASCTTVWTDWLVVVAGPAELRSEILRSQFLFRSMAPGRNLLCTTFAECRYLRPRSNWYMKYWKWASVSGCLE